MIEQERKLIDSLNRLTDKSDEVVSHCTSELDLLQLLCDLGHSELSQAYSNASARVPFWYE